MNRTLAVKAAAWAGALVFAGGGVWVANAGEGEAEPVKAPVVQQAPARTQVYVPPASVPAYSSYDSTLDRMEREQEERLKELAYQQNLRLGQLESAQRQAELNARRAEQDAKQDAYFQEIERQKAEQEQRYREQEQRRMQQDLDRLERENCTGYFC